MQQVLEIVGLFLLASVKFLFAPGATVAAGYGFWETLLINLSGGFFGVFVFYYSGRLLMTWWQGFFPAKKGTRFTRRNKLIVRTKNKFGLAGLAALLGVISIPLAAFLAARYFRYNPRTLPYLLASVLIWALCLTTFSVFVKNQLF